MEDELFQVDDQYRSLKQQNVNWIRQHRPNIYWSMIWYFCSVKLPYEFLIPYEEKELAEDFYKDYLILKAQLRIEEMVNLYGQDQVDKFIERRILKAIKSNKEKQEKNVEEQKADHSPRNQPMKMQGDQPQVSGFDLSNNNKKVDSDAKRRQH